MSSVAGTLCYLGTSVPHVNPHTSASAYALCGAASTARASAARPQGLHSAACEALNTASFFLAQHGAFPWKPLRHCPGVVCGRRRSVGYVALGPAVALGVQAGGVRSPFAALRATQARAHVNKRWHMRVYLLTRGLAKRRSALVKFNWNWAGQPDSSWCLTPFWANTCCFVFATECWS